MENEKLKRSRRIYGMKETGEFEQSKHSESMSGSLYPQPFSTKPIYMFKLTHPFPCFSCMQY